MRSEPLLALIVLAASVGGCNRVAGGRQPATAEGHPANADGPPPADGAPQWLPMTPAQGRAFEVADLQTNGGMVCALSRDHRVACWGDQFRWGEFSWRPPTAVPQLLGGVNDAQDIAIGGALFILRGDGSVTRIRDREQKAVPGLRGIVQLEGAEEGVCGRGDDGDVWCHGQWASWKDSERKKPERIGLRDCVGLACGARGCCGWTAEGVLSCLGDSEALGFRRRPKRMTVNGVTGVDLGLDTACAQTSEGSKCWGDDPGERVGEEWRPPAGARIFPGDEPCWLAGETLTCVSYEGSWTAKGVDALFRHRDYASCVVSPAGALSCWGSNEYGSLGDGVPMQRSEPAEVRGVAATGISAGHSETCVTTEAGEWVCWGEGTGAPARAGSAPSVRVRGQNSATCGIWGGWQCQYRDRDGYEAVRYGSHGSFVAAAMDRGPNLCGLDAAGAVACRYSLGEGGLDETWHALATPEPVVRVAPMAVGFVFLGKSGRVYQWDDERFDQDDDFVDAPGSEQTARPIEIEHATAIAAHQNGGCASTKSGPVKCWGGIGFGHEYAPRELTTVPGMDGAVALSSNHFHVCGLVGTEVRCFGHNEYGQLGYETEGEGSSEAKAVDLPGPAAEVAVGADHTCARLQDGRVFCWGRDQAGQLGQGRIIRATKPRPTMLGPH